MERDEDLSREVMSYMGVTGEVCPVAGGVKFTIAHRPSSGHVMLGTNHQFVIVDMTPDDAMELAQRLIDAARGARENASSEPSRDGDLNVLPTATVISSKILRTLTLLLAVLAVAILCGLVSR